MTKSFWLISAGMLALCAPAHAQDDPELPAEDSPLEAADVEDEDNAGDVIIVTAQGREQILQDVPISVNVVSGEALENSGASDIRELNQLAPSLLVSSTGNEANGAARIRGIGTVGDNPGLESSVAVFIDGVYRSRTGNALSDLGPIERVEVLRGPQGTLFGRNASAGLLNIVTEGPRFDLAGYAAATYGNYDHIRAEAGINVPLGTGAAFRLDGVYVNREGFYDDLINDIDVNNRDRFLVRGQFLVEPDPDVSLRFIADYSKKDERCCAAVFVQPEFAPLATVNPDLNPFTLPSPSNPPLTSTANPIIPVLLALGQDPRALEIDMFERDIFPTPGRSYAGETEDYGLSLEVDWDLGGAELTSITAFREYDNFQAGDVDYTTVDIFFRAPGENAGARAFSTFSQELRLQGTAFNDRLDWLIGAYYAQEDLTVRENLKFGSQYGPFLACRIGLGVDALGLLPVPFTDPFSPSCISPTARAIVDGTLTGTPAFGPATPILLGGFDRLATISNVGDEGTRYFQDSRNLAFFTHNIVHLTDRLDLTLGLRYTDENKDFSADFNNTNTVCPAQRAALSPLLNAPTIGALAGGLISAACQGNNSAELNALNLSDERDESELTGTAVLSYKPTEEWLLYASYSRGYKAGGFNLDRSALTGNVFSPADPVGANNLSIILGPTLLADPANLQFEEETVDAFEIGAKYGGSIFTLAASAFYQEFSNFQLNTFNGTVFLVQNINSCATDLGGADEDAGGLTGACDPDNVEPGVISQGIELEGTLSPGPDLIFTAGFTYADTSYEEDLIGDDSGAPLDPALRLLPGDNLSNAPEIVLTGSLTWTPRLTADGIEGLFFVNARYTGDYNTGSDLLFGKEQESYVVVNARLGVRGPGDGWALEAWAANLFDADYSQVAFNTPFIAPQQTYSAFLAEPRTYGLTARLRF
ncbi:MAG: TonB-dependent receptor [Sphingomonadaceae bacterium]